MSENRRIRPVVHNISGPLFHPRYLCVYTDCVPNEFVGSARSAFSAVACGLNAEHQFISDILKERFFFFCVVWTFFHSTKRKHLSLTTGFVDSDSGQKMYYLPPPPRRSVIRIGLEHLPSFWLFTCHSIFVGCIFNSQSKHLSSQQHKRAHNRTAHTRTHTRTIVEITKYLVLIFVQFLVVVFFARLFFFYRAHVIFVFKQINIQHWPGI